MTDYLAQLGGTFLNRLIQGEPGVFIGPISAALGWIINIIYTLWSFITPAGALGVAIIIMTIIVRTALLPSSAKMVRNNQKMRVMKPEMDKINEKYGATRDPELRRKKQLEIQALQQKHGINMLATCLPMLITWPLFMALFAVLNQAFLFVGSVGDVYSNLSYALINLEGIEPGFLYNTMAPLAREVTPMSLSGLISLDVVSDMNRIIHVLSPESWEVIFSSITDTAARTNIQQLYDTKVGVSTFLTINLVNPAGTAFPGVLLPILSALTMFLSQYLMNRLNPAMDGQARTMQKVTMFIFPVMFAFFTIGAPAGVGVYWVMLNVCMAVQHYFIVKYYAKKDAAAQAKA